MVLHLDRCHAQRTQGVVEAWSPLFLAHQRRGRAQLGADVPPQAGLDSQDDKFAAATPVILVTIPEGRQWAPGLRQWLVIFSGRVVAVDARVDLFEQGDLPWLILDSSLLPFLGGSHGSVQKVDRVPKRGRMCVVAYAQEIPAAVLDSAGSRCHATT